ncbi:MAG TPA: DUF1559 domain-containing protein [Gemmataceae bacterium]|nr:DUF1559 domain-containing protein [Gemmataceae bacterium]
MAASTQFKQQCPSCEAMVPIKDSSMIGKKVDCPKCKYRFVVEDPGNGDGEETKTKPKSAAVTKSKPGKAKTRPDRDLDDDDGEGKPKAKKSGGGGNAMMYVGIGLGVLAVIGLVVVGIIIFGGSGNNSSGSSSSSNSSNSSKPGTTSPPSKPTTDPNAGKSDSSENAGGNAEPGDSSGQVNISNLLPNETQSVNNVFVNKFTNSTPGGAMFSSTAGFRREMCKDQLGLPLESMMHFIRAENVKNGWVFNVVQMSPKYSIDINELKSKLGSRKGPKSPLKKHEYFLTSPNDLLDTLANLDPSALAGQKVAVQPKKRPANRDLAWHLYDAQTLIVADVDMMEQFLQADRVQPAITKSTSGSSMNPNMPNMPQGPGGLPVAAGSGGPGKQPGGGADGPPGRPSMPSMPPGGPGMMPPRGSGGPGGPGGPGVGMFSEKNTYMTVREDLKAMLDRMEEAKQVIFSSAAVDLEDMNAAIVNNIRGTSGLGAIPPLPAITTAGVGLHTFSENRVTGVIAIELKREDEARKLAEALQLAMPLLSSGIGKWMGITISSSNSNFPGAPGMNPGMMPAGSGPVGAQPGMMPPGAGSMRPGMAPGSGPGGPGMIPPGSGPGGPGMIPPGAGSGRPGGGLPPNPYGPNAPGGPGNPGGPGTDTPSANQATSSTIQVTSSGKTVYINVDLEVNEATNEKFRNAIEGQVVRLKGMLDVQAMTTPRWHELAGTAITLKNQKKALIGAYRITGEGQVAYGGSPFISRSPSQRVSWMVDLLPMLGKEDIYQQIDPKQPWRNEKNLRAGTNWIPQFINPNYPRESWQATLPSLPGQSMGATHFVGLSGIGLDAAEYMPNDPATAKKLGMFGYNREIRFSDIKDGLSNTIYMIQVPPTLQRPWIAGGGATVQGVPEKNSIAPFVYQQANGKRGTYVLMADGSVRFVSESIPDKTFQAMVTIAGEDDVSDMNAHSQVVPVPKPAGAVSTAAPDPKAPGK